MNGLMSVRDDLVAIWCVWIILTLALVCACVILRRFFKTDEEKAAIKIGLRNGIAITVAGAVFATAVCVLFLAPTKSREYRNIAKPTVAVPDESHKGQTSEEIVTTNEGAESPEKWEEDVEEENTEAMNSALELFRSVEQKATQEGLK